MPFPPTFTNVWDITTPPDTQLANLLGQDIRNLKNDVMQRISLLSGTLANRPTPETLNATWGGSGFGLLYFATDTGQIFQWNGAAWAQVFFFGGNQAAIVNLTGQVANIASTTLFSVVSAGLYRLSADSAAVSGTGTLPGLSIGWTDSDTNSILGANPYAASPGTAPLLATNPTQLLMYAKAGTNITYQTTGYAGSINYTLRLRLENLG